MPDLQRYCGVHPYHPVDTCQGAVNFVTGAEPLFLPPMQSVFMPLLLLLLLPLLLLLLLLLPLILLLFPSLLPFLLSCVCALHVVIQVLLLHMHCTNGGTMLPPSPEM